MRRRRWPGACRCPGAGGSDRRAHRYKKRDLPRSDLNRQPAVPDCRARRRGADYRAGGLAPRAFTCSRQRTARDRPGNRPAAAGQERYCRRRLKARGSFRQGKARRDRWRDTGRHTASLVDGDISSFSLASWWFQVACANWLAGSAGIRSARSCLLVGPLKSTVPRLSVVIHAVKMLPAQGRQPVAAPQAGSIFSSRPGRIAAPPGRSCKRFPVGRGAQILRGNRPGNRAVHIRI